jgi:WD40 repeat protein
MCNVGGFVEELDDVESDPDMWFRVGMNIFSTLLSHSMKFRDGWIELMKSLSLYFVDDPKREIKGLPRNAIHATLDPQKNPVGRRVANAVLSNLLCDLAHIMPRIYDHIKTSLRSKDTKKHSNAMSRLETILAVFVVSEDFILQHTPVVTTHIPDFSVARTRMRFVRETQEQSDALRGLSGLPKVDNKNTTPLKEVTKLAEKKLVYYLNNSSPREKFKPSIDLEDITLTTGLSVGVSDLNISADGQPSSAQTGEADSDDVVYADFAHVWYGIPKSNEKEDEERALLKVGSFGGNFGKTIATSLKQGTDGPARGRSASSLSQMFDVHLEPLEMVAGSRDGTLILTLQALRYFDSIFWPEQGQLVRNKHLLKEFLSNPLVFANEKITKIDGHMRNGAINMYSAACRLMINALNVLSPTDGLSVLNLQRMQKFMVGTSGSVPQEQSPVLEWIVTGIHHVIVNLQRVAYALTPIFESLGLPGKALMVVLAGSENEVYSADMQEEIEAEEKIFVILQENAPLMDDLKDIFKGSAGRNILAYVKQGISFLDQCFSMDNVREGLINMLRRVDYDNLDEFIDCVTKLVEKVESEKTSNGDKSIRNRQSALSESNSSMLSDDDVLSRDSSIVREALSVSETDSPHRATDGSIGLRTGSILQTVGGAVSGAASSLTASGVSVLGSARPSNFSVGRISAPGLTRVDTAERSDFRSAFKGEGSSKDDEFMKPLGEIHVLQLLRHKFIRTTNLLRSLAFTQALLTVETVEKENMVGTHDQLKFVFQAMETLNDPTKSKKEESHELREVGYEVVAMLTNKEKNSMLARKAQEESHFRFAATRWQQLLQEYDSNWSPWGPDDVSGDAEGSPGITQYVLSRQWDTRLRRMILSRSEEERDHRDASYFESKQKWNAADLRDQSGDAAAVDITHKVGWMKNAAKGTIVDGTSWGDDEEDVFENEKEEKLKGNSGNGEANVLGLGNLFSQTHRPQWAEVFPWALDERMVYIGEATRLTIEYRIKCELLLTNKCLYYHVLSIENVEEGGEPPSFEDTRWRLDKLTEMYGRRNMQRKCAIELFFLDQPEALFVFSSLAELQKFFRVIRRQATPILASYTSNTLNPAQVIASSPYTELWRRRLISNYEYLMRLNIAAGRSFNDISQYPVFPWVLADFKSDWLDFNDPATFRDLSRPMGALDAERLEYFEERYRSFEEDSPMGPPFLYGSHYSTEGYVIHYMIRQEPFTTLAVKLQGGRFDCPDRLFFDIQQSWEGSSKLSNTDVKELIPEFFCCPELLLNTSKLPLGELQSGEKIDNVLLPPWAIDAFEFVRIHREALESDYVSEHINEWIDLIFGNKQRGKAAEDALNVFHYLTYEDAVDFENVEEEFCDAIRAQIMHYGQTPAQLFRKPHPKRYPKEECMNPLCGSTDESLLAKISIFTPKQHIDTSRAGERGAVISIRCSHDRLVTVHADFTVSYYRWSVFPDGDKNPFQVRFEKSKVLPSAPWLVSEDVLGTRSFVPQAPPTSRSRHATSVECRSRHGTDVSTRTRGDSQKSNQFYRNSAGFAADKVAGILAANASGTRSESNADSESQGKAKPKKFRPKKLMRNLKNNLTFGSNSSQKRSEDIDPTLATVEKQASVKSIDKHVYIVGDHLFNPESSFRTQLLNEECADPLPAITHRNVAVSMSETSHGGQIISCGYWDDSIRVHALDGLKDYTAHGAGHRGQVTSVQVGSQGGVFVTGGDDCTCRVWAVDTAPHGNAHAAGEFESLRCLHVLHGHRSPITALSYSPDIDLLLSGSADGLLCLHSVRKGAYIRSIPHILGCSADVLQLSPNGYMAAYSNTDTNLHVFWVNGSHLATAFVDTK